MTSRLLVDKIEGKTTANTVQMPVGHVVQFVNSNANAAIVTTSTSDVDTGITLDITPKFSTSKLWILFSGRLYINQHSSEYVVNIKKGSTIIGGGATLFSGSSGDRMAETCNIQCFDSPSSTSQQTYKVTHRVSAGEGHIMPNSHPNDVGANFVIMEIAQ